MSTDWPRAFADAPTGANIVAGAIDSAESVPYRLSALGTWRQMKTRRVDVPDACWFGFRPAERGGVLPERAGAVS